jgi:hypothetical protein
VGIAVGLLVGLLLGARVGTPVGGRVGDCAKGVCVREARVMHPVMTPRGRVRPASSSSSSSSSPSSTSARLWSMHTKAHPGGARCGHRRRPACGPAAGAPTRHGRGGSRGGLHGTRNPPPKGCGVRGVHASMSLGVVVARSRLTRGHGRSHHVDPPTGRCMQDLWSTFSRAYPAGRGGGGGGGGLAWPLHNNTHGSGEGSELISRDPGLSRVAYVGEGGEWGSRQRPGRIRHRRRPPVVQPVMGSDLSS